MKTAFLVGCHAELSGWFAIQRRKPGRTYGSQLCSRECVPTHHCLRCQELMLHYLVSAKKIQPPICYPYSLQFSVIARRKGQERLNNTQQACVNTNLKCRTQKQRCNKLLLKKRCLFRPIGVKIIKLETLPPGFVISEQWCLKFHHLRVRYRKKELWIVNVDGKTNSSILKRIRSGWGIFPKKWLGPITGWVRMTKFLYSASSRLHSW